MAKQDDTVGLKAVVVAGACLRNSPLALGSFLCNGWPSHKSQKY